MADIVISGNTSGSVTLRAPDTSGSTVLTLPTTTGTLVVTGGAQTVQFAAGSAASPSITFTGDTNTGIFSPAADTIAFSEGGVESMRIDASGNVGIGTSSPSATLDVRNTSNEQIRFGYTGTPNYCSLGRNSGTGNFNIFVNSAEPLVFGTNATERMRITSAGRVGISNSSPEYLLNVGSSSSIASLAGVGLTLFASGGLTSSIGGVLNFRPALGTDISKIFNLSICAYDHSGDGNADGLSINGSDGISFCTGGDSRNERMRIDGSGNVLIGTTSQNLGGRVFNVFTPNNVCGSFYRGTSNNDDEVLEVRSNVSSTNNLRFRVLASGNVQNSNNSYGGISDVKLKENIVDANPKLEKLNQVRVVTYNLKGDTTKQIGVVAQELEQVFPSLVEEVIDRDEDGNDLGTATKSVKYSVFVPMLIKAIQELNAKVEAQAAEIAALKGVN